MSKGLSGAFTNTNGYIMNSSYLNGSSEVESYSYRGIDIPDNVKEYLSRLHDKGDYIMGSSAEFGMTDVSIMSKETGVEFAHVTIGEKAYLIRGDKKGTTIPNKLLKKMEKHSGILDFHSHPYDDDCIPSKSDRLLMKKLREVTGQQHSSIVTPNGKTTRFNEHGVIETGIVENRISDSHKKQLLKLFGGDT
ncbi:MAG: hypothetical protein NC078_06295 [Ruminococcus sp.]|nr:hypothetical protein [Ruminococcus sp.]